MLRSPSGTFEDLHPSAGLSSGASSRFVEIVLATGEPMRVDGDVNMGLPAAWHMRKCVDSHGGGEWGWQQGLARCMDYARMRKFDAGGGRHDILCVAVRLNMLRSPGMRVKPPMQSFAEHV